MERFDIYRGKIQVEWILGLYAVFKCSAVITVHAKAFL